MGGASLALIKFHSIIKKNSYLPHPKCFPRYLGITNLVTILRLTLRRMAGWNQRACFHPWKDQNRCCQFQGLPKVLEGAAESNFQLSVLKIGGLDLNVESEVKCVHIPVFSSSVNGCLRR